MTQREGEEGEGGELNLEWESSHTGKEEVEGVHLSRLRTDTPTIHQERLTHQNQQSHQTNKKGGENSRRRRVQVHLSRLWTDTPIQVKTQNRERKNETGQKHGEERESTSAPVTSMDRHTSTGDDRENKPKGVTMETQCSEGRRRSTSAPVTSMDRHTRTKS